MCELGPPDDVTLPRRAVPSEGSAVCLPMGVFPTALIGGMKTVARALGRDFEYSWNVIHKIYLTCFLPLGMF